MKRPSDQGQNIPCSVVFSQLYLQTVNRQIISYLNFEDLD
jgi:hypothetical protein